VAVLGFVAVGLSRRGWWLLNFLSGVVGIVSGGDEQALCVKSCHGTGW